MKDTLILIQKDILRSPLIFIVFKTFLRSDCDIEKRWITLVFLKTKLQYMKRGIFKFTHYGVRVCSTVVRGRFLEHSRI